MACCNLGVAQYQTQQRFLTSYPSSKQCLGKTTTTITMSETKIKETLQWNRIWIVLMVCTKQFNSSKIASALGFPGGAVVENLPANAGDTGSSPGLGRSHMPRSN